MSMKRVSEGAEGRSHGALGAGQEHGWNAGLFVNMQTMDLWQELESSLGILLDNHTARLAVCDVLPHIDCAADLDGSQPDGILQCVTSLQSLFGRSVALTAKYEHLSFAGGH